MPVSLALALAPFTFSVPALPSSPALAATWTAGRVHAISVSAAPAAFIIGRPDKGDEESAFIAGLAQRGLHDMVVRESKTFLNKRPSHRKAPAVRYRMAGALYDLGQTQAALAAYKQLDRLVGFEQAAEVSFRVGQCSLDLGQGAAAIEAFNKVRTGNADYLKVAATQSLGDALFLEKRYKDAGTAYNAVLSGGKDAADYERDARYGLTWSAWKAGDKPGTISAAKSFLARFKDDEQAGEMAFLVGEALLESDKAAEAIQWYGRVKSGTYVEAALRGAAFADAARGDHRAAAGRFGSYLQSYPTGQFAAEAALQRGVQLVRAEAFAEAATVLASPPTPDDAQTRYWRALAEAGRGQYEASLAQAQAGLKKRPDEAMAVQLRIAAGDALFELGRAKEAAQLYESSGSAYALHAAAVARLNDGDAEEAERLAKTLLSGACREPGSEYRAEALGTRAEALFRLERYAEAEGVLRTILAEGGRGANNQQPRTAIPADAMARAGSRLAWCRWYGDDVDAARQLFDSVARNTASDDAIRSEARFMSGRCALKGGDEGGARQAFARYVEAAPTGPFAAESLLRLARLTPGPGGLAMLERLLKDHASSELAATALSELAERKVAAGDSAGAEAAYAALVERFPNDDAARAARYGLGWSKYQSGDLDGAAAPLWSVAQDKNAADDLRDGALELLVWVESGAKRPDRALTAMRAFAARSKDEGKVLAAARVVDRALADAGDSKGRTTLWNEINAKVKGPEAVAAARVEQGFAALDAGDPEGAARHAITARASAPESPAVAELLYFCGEAYFDAGDDEKATALYVAASAHGSPEVAERAFYKGGFAELRRGRNAEAAASFASLAERFPSGALAPESMFLAGEAFYREGKDDEAVQWLRRMVNTAPRHAARPKALFRLGLAEGRREAWRPSAEALAELVLKFPEFPSLTEAELWRGRAMSRTGERRAARQSLSRVVEGDEGILGAQARIELGRLSEAENDPEGAISEYLKVAVLYGHAEECAEALVRAGDVLAKKGEADRAKGQYSEAVEKYPATAWAKTAKERLAKKGG